MPYSGFILIFWDNKEWHFIWFCHRQNFSSLITLKILYCYSAKGCYVDWVNKLLGSQYGGKISRHDHILIKAITSYILRNFLTNMSWRKIDNGFSNFLNKIPIPLSVQHGRVAQWITRLTTDQKIPGSNPGVLEFCLSKENWKWYYIFW